LSRFRQESEVRRLAVSLGNLRQAWHWWDDPDDRTPAALITALESALVTGDARAIDNALAACLAPLK
jgi:hypothetical protein